MKIFLIAIFLFIPQIIIGGDLYILNIIGFSNDAKYLAFEIYGIYDGSAAPFSKIYIINTINNKYETEPVFTSYDVNPDSFDESETLLKKARKENLEKAKSYLNKYSIISGNCGTNKFDSPENGYLVLDNNGNCCIENPVLNNKEVTFIHQNSKYILELEEKDCSCPKYNYIDAKIFSLSLKTEYDRKYLQNDKKLPKSRLCPLKYGIFSVYLYENIIAVFIAYSQAITFEEPNMEKMVVTGKLY